jgi:hypothetical protein
MDKTDDILALEAEHGFVFGLPADYDNNAAPVVGTVACNNPDCHRRGQQHTLHADTAQPIICGGCSNVLMCGHKRITDPPEVHYGGTMAEPIRHEIVSCLDCRAVLNHTPRRVGLHEVPLDAFRPH